MHCHDRKHGPRVWKSLVNECKRVVSCSLISMSHEQPREPRGLEKQWLTMKPMVHSYLPYLREWWLDTSLCLITRWRNSAEFRNSQWPKSNCLSNCSWTSELLSEESFRVTEIRPQRLRLCLLDYLTTLCRLQRLSGVNEEWEDDDKFI
jgi:hypothetical protein